MRRLLFVASAVVFLDVVFYSAITPLLPTYVDDLGLSKTEAGVLAGAYAAGTLVASLPAGYFAARFGARRALVAGLTLLGAASLAFGFAEQAWALDLARFVQGVAGALAWAGALTWLILAAPEGRRGRVIGDVLGVAVAGALFGPALGALAEGIGTEPIFSSVLVITTALSIAALRLPESAPGEQQEVGEIAAAIRTPPVLRGALYVAAPSALFGVVNVLAPLRIDDLGGTAAVVAASFTFGAALGAVLAPLSGRWSDRVGRLRPFLIGILVCVASVVLIPATSSLGGVLVVLALVEVGAGICFAPALAILSDAADLSGLHQGLATGLINIAWALGQMTGSAGGGAAAGAAGDVLPCVLVATLLLVTAATAVRSMPRLPSGLAADPRP
jgi:MFS family permease